MNEFLIETADGNEKQSESYILICFKRQIMSDQLQIKTLY